MSHKTPIYILEVEQGAQFEPYQSWEIAGHFGDPLAEYDTLRRDVGAIDLCYTSILRVTGHDRVRYLHNMLSNDIRSLRSGFGCHAALLTHQGHMETELRVYASEECLWLEVPPAGLERALSTLRKYVVSDKVEIEDWTDKLVVFSLQGPGSRKRVEKFLGSSPADLAPLGYFAFSGRSATWHIVHRDRSGCDGYDLWLPAQDAEHVWRRWTFESGIRPAGHEALNWLRIEAGIPWYGIDMNERSLPVDMGLDSAISLNKGCYRGQEIVARILHRGHLNRRLAGLCIHHPLVPAQGCGIRAAGERVGEVTSAVFSPRLQKPLALAVIKTDFLQPGTHLDVDYGAEAVPAEIIALPLH